MDQSDLHMPISAGVTIRHWLPILTFCPVNKRPDLIYVSLYFELDDEFPFVELYAVRKAVRRLLSGKTIFMEDAAAEVAAEFPRASRVEVRLAFNRHVVTLEF